MIRICSLTAVSLVVLINALAAEELLPESLHSGAVTSCTATRCQTPVKEVHADGCGSETDLELVFTPPPNVTFDSSGGHFGGTEIEGSGSTHYVNALGAGPSWLKCKWYAAPKCFGDNGLAKGFCWIDIKK